MAPSFQNPDMMFTFKEKSPNKNGKNNIYFQISELSSQHFISFFFQWWKHESWLEETTNSSHQSTQGAPVSCILVHVQANTWNLPYSSKVMLVCKTEIVCKLQLKTFWIFFSNFKRSVSIELPKLPLKHVIKCSKKK